jgi:hypothetical protein
LAEFSGLMGDAGLAGFSGLAAKSGFAGLVSQSSEALAEAVATWVFCRPPVTCLGLASFALANPIALAFAAALRKSSCSSRRRTAWAAS